MLPPSLPGPAPHIPVPEGAKERAVSGFLAVVLVCAAATPVDACDEAKAVDVRSVRVANELGCATGWQEIIARQGDGAGLEAGAYLKTACRRLPQAAGAPPAPR